MTASRTDDRPVIVVADDDRSIRFGLACFLEAEGFRVVEAQDGAEALKAIHREDPAAVLLDLKMPNVDGLAVLAELGPKLSRPAGDRRHGLRRLGGGDQGHEKWRL